MISTTNDRLVQHALQVAEHAHRGQRRASGTDYIDHPKAVMEILRSIHADAETLAAALLHDTLEDTPVTAAQIRRQFGPEVAQLVEGVTKVQIVEKTLTVQERNLESIRKMFRVMGSDVRVIFIKLADRLHNMQTLEYLPQEKQQRIARETADIFCPLARMLGLWNWYQQLSELCLKVTNPAEFRMLKKKYRRLCLTQLPSLERWARQLEKDLLSKGYTVRLELRPRNVANVHRSISGNASLLDQIESFIRICLITDTTDACYRILGAVHQWSSPIAHHFADFIAHPKMNGYQALHTTVVSIHGKPIKLLIQTEEMHRQSEFGASLPYQRPSHNEDATPWKTPPAWVQSFISLERQRPELSQFFRTVQSEILGERKGVHILGARKRFLELPAHATILDAAYFANPHLGNRAVSALVNGVESSLKRTIEEGDIIEIRSRAFFQRSADDLRILQTMYAQQLLLEKLQRLSGHEKRKHGMRLMNAALNAAIDPFFPIEWKKHLHGKLLRDRTVLAHVGGGTLNPFEALENMCGPEDLLLLDPRCFAVGTRMPRGQKIRFLLKTNIQHIRAGNILGLQIRPDVIEVYDASQGNELHVQHPNRELVPLQIVHAETARFPFHFAIQWSFRPGGNPLKIIAHLQNLLDTPVALLAFEHDRVTLGFHTDHLETVRWAFEYLERCPDVERIARISP